MLNRFFNLIQKLNEKFLKCNFTDNKRTRTFYFYSDSICTFLNDFTNTKNSLCNFDVL